MRLRVWFCVLLMCVGVFAAQAQSVSTSEEPNILGSTPLGGLNGATSWINSKPLTAKDLKGKVVLVDFWTYSCINCLRTLPYLKAWADKYKDAGLVVIGVHTPEFDFEKQLPNIEHAVKKFGITYPIAVDSNRAVWDSFHNEYWPAHYFLDAKGRVRYEHFGEGEYAESEQHIQELLKEAHAQVSAGTVRVNGQGIQAAADMASIGSPETYIGYARARNFRPYGDLARDREKLYTLPANLERNAWGLSGKWLDTPESATAKSIGNKIAFRFHARDLHLVLGTVGGKPVRYRVTIDGHAPDANHGVDTDGEGNGTVAEHRLYQLVRLSGPVEDHLFTIEFLDPGVEAFSFTFG